jgi:hypothetical protein
VRLAGGKQICNPARPASVPSNQQVKVDYEEFFLRLEQETEEFVGMVENSFKATLYPGDDNNVVNSGVYVDDAVTTLKSFKGEHWREVSLDTLILNRDHLPFFTPDAYHFISLRS